ncbi:MAG: hypothetical protein OXM55_01730 [Bdellovibrionales bacterium]|nr:hypothetical protein [Bdellovibrionales bacterium]
MKHLIVEIVLLLTYTSAQAQNESVPREYQYPIVEDFCVALDRDRHGERDVMLKIIATETDRSLLTMMSLKSSSDTLVAFQPLDFHGHLALTIAFENANKCNRGLLPLEELTERENKCEKNLLVDIKNLLCNTED